MNWIKSIANDQFNVGLTKSTWVNLGENNDTSAYVNSLGKMVESVFNNIKDIIAENFCYHILNSLPKILTESFLMNLYKIKKIDESGAEKMLIDVFLIKQNVLKLYNYINAAHGNKTTTGENDFNLIWYSKDFFQYFLFIYLFFSLNQAMKKEFSKIESRLKCLGSKVNQMGDAYKSLVEDKSKEDFDRLILIRGVKKTDILDYEKII